MTQFEENHLIKLSEFYKRVMELVDEYHADIYLVNGIINGITKIEIAILDELNKDKEN
jgi:hypothetical protein